MAEMYDRVKQVLTQQREARKGISEPWANPDPNLKPGWAPTINPNYTNPHAQPVVQQSASQTAALDANFSDYMRDHAGSGDAWAYLQNLLNDYGLGDLNDFAKQSIIDGLSSNEIIQRLRTTDVYKKRFAVIEQRKQQGLPPISEGEVLQYEKQATAMMRGAGLPKGFYDSPDDFQKLQLNDVSLSELEARINNGYLQASQASAEDRAQWKQLGLGEGDLAAFFLDPDKATNVIQEQFGAVQRAQEAKRVGYGQLSRADAEMLSRMGVSSDQSVQGFSQLAKGKELMQGLPGENVDQITRDEQLAATFKNDVNQQNRIENRANERKNTFKGTAAFAQNKEGFGGLGTAR